MTGIGSFGKVNMLFLLANNAVRLFRDGIYIAVAGQNGAPCVKKIAILPVCR